MKYEKGNMKLWTLKQKLTSKHMIIINDNDYSNPYDESNDNKAKIKEWITKIIKVLPACMVIITIMIEIIKILKVENREMQYGMRMKNLKN